MKNILEKFKYLIFTCFFISIYLFSRLTVDDAFIGWRYGKNCIFKI